MPKERLERSLLNKTDDLHRAKSSPTTLDVDESDPQHYSSLSDQQRTILTLQQTRGNAAVVRMLTSHGLGGRIQRRPSYLVDFTFLGWPCGGGVNPKMKKKLQDVQTDLQATFDALPADQKTNPITGDPATTLRDWSGIRQDHGCWHPKGGKHSSGSACDINYDTNPYIATRTEGTDSKGKPTTTYGGELAGSGLQTQRHAATDVYDRAKAFVGAAGDRASVGIRQPGESTGDVYDRFKATSDALATYLQFAFRSDAATHVNRPPVPNSESASLDVLLKAIPDTERLPESEARDNIDQEINNSEFQIIHPNWPYPDVDSQYLRMLRDYELVRVPMVFGQPSARPGSTRNPANGFLDLRRELVVSLVDIGHLRWGACDFGAAESGDMQHFDLGDHGGYTPSDV